jgi:hypothetical protein
MAANKFVLKGSGVEVDYTIGANPSFPALVYTSGAFQKKFKPNQILSEDTGLGEMVSVALILSIDTGGERFGFFLPLINVERGQTAHFSTVGVYETFSGAEFRSASAFDMALHRNDRNGAERNRAPGRAR